MHICSYVVDTEASTIVVIFAPIWALGRGLMYCFVCLFDLILYIPSTIFQLNRDGSSWVIPVLSKDKCVLLKDHNAVIMYCLQYSIGLLFVQGGVNLINTNDLS